MRRKTITITVIYHPPPKNMITNGMFIDITDHLTSLLPTTTKNIILGDFNMHINDINSNDAIIFKDTLMALGLTQLVTTSTHAKGNILDLILTEEAARIKLTSCQVGPFLSGHNMVSAVIIIKKPPTEKSHYQYVNLNALLRRALKQPLMKIPLILPPLLKPLLLLRKLQSAKDNLGLMRLLRLDIKWYETGSRFGINILYPILGRPTKWKGMYTTNFSIIRKNSLLASRSLTQKAITESFIKKLHTWLESTLTTHYLLMIVMNPLQTTSQITSSQRLIRFMKTLLEHQHLLQR